MREARTRVFLLDDHEVVRLGVRDLLESEGDIEVVGESGHARQALHRILALRPDVAVLDGRLPDGSGIDVCREVRSRERSIAVLILTSDDDDAARHAAVTAGAAGYLLKDIRGSELVDSVRKVAAGGSVLDPALTQVLVDRLRRGPGGHPALALLSARERELLEHLGRGMTNRQIGASMFLAETTIRNYVSALLTKLGLERRTQAAVFAVTHLAPRPAGTGGRDHSLPGRAGNGQQPPQRLTNLAVPRDLARSSRARSGPQ